MKVKDNEIKFLSEQQHCNDDEFTALCRPVVEYLQKKHHPHSRIIIEWDRASLAEDICGVPFQVPD